MKKILLIIFLLPFLGFTQALSGSYVIKTTNAAPFNTLVNAVERINTVGLSGPVAFLLDENQTVTSQITINQLTGTSITNTLTIKPNDGKNITISGNINNGAVLALNSADNIIIDGNNTISDNMLTIHNTNSLGNGQRAGIWLYDNSEGNKIQNLKINLEIGGITTGILSVGIFSGGNSLGNNGNNSKNTIKSVSFTNVKQAIMIKGQNQNNIDWNILNNSIESTNNNTKAFLGIYVLNVANYTVSGNKINGIRLPPSFNGNTSHSGIYLESANGGIIEKNIVSNVENNIDNGYGYGIYVKGNNNRINENSIKNLNSSSTNDGSYGIKSEGNNVTIYKNDIANVFSSQGVNTNGIYISGNNQLVYNNFINDVKSAGGGNPNSQSGSGIYINNGSVVKLYHNTVVIKTNQNTGVSAALFIKGGTQLDIRNNIFVNNQTSGSTRFAVYSEVTNSNSFNFLEYNNYYSTQHIGSWGDYYNSTNIKTTLTSWQSTTGKEGNSKNVNPVFTNSTLDLLVNNTENEKLLGTTTLLSTVVDDIYGTTRGVPYIGAHEVCKAPSITTQPVTPTGTCSGSGTQTMTVVATGAGLTYQWRKAGINISNGGVISGATTATLTLTNPTAADAGSYDVVVSGTCTPSVTSTARIVTINTAPAITTQPSTPTATCSGSGTQTMTVVATGAGLTYQWRKAGINISNGGVISGATTATLTLTNPTAADAGSYDVVVTGTCTPAVTSNAVIVTVNPPPTVSNAGPDQALANATSFTLGANTPTVGNGIWTVASGPSTLSSQFSNTTSPNATFTPAIAGTYLLNWTISNSCGSSVDQVVVTNKCERNLLISGDFTEDNTKWTYATTKGNTTEIYPESIYFLNSNDSFAAELDSKASLRQEVTLIPGVSYTVSFRYARRPTMGTPATTGVMVKITGGTSDLISTGFTTTDTTPKTGTFTFTPTSSSVGIEFYNHLDGGKTLGTIMNDIVLLPASQATPYAVTNPKGVFNTTTTCAGVSVQLGVENAPTSGVTYAWTGSVGAVFSATNIKEPTVKFTNSGLQQTATVTVTTAAGCSTSSTTYFNVGVTPTITAPAASAICSGSTYSSGAITSTGMTYDWSRAAIAGINGGAANTGGTNNNATGFTEVLTNATSNPISVTYVLTPKSTATTCAGIPYNLVVTVNPRPSVPTAAVTAQPNCSELTGTIVLSGLPLTGTINQTTNGVTTSFAVSQISGEQKIDKLAAGSYTFTVTQGSCTSDASNPVNIIAFSRATIIWNGTAWSPAGRTPTIEDRVEFHGSYTSGTNSPANVDACSCYIDGKNSIPAVVLFQKGHTLNVKNEVQVLNGSLTFEDKASLVQHTDVLLKPNFGSITYERKTTITRYDYTYWSSPVKDQTLKNLSYYTLFDRYFKYDDGWVTIRSGNAPMYPGHGYIIRGPQNSSITEPATFSGVFKGEVNNGVINDLAVVAGKDYLLGNPYPSAIDADKFLNDVNNAAILQGTLYFWTHNTEPVAAQGTTTYKYAASDYASYNKSGGIGTSPSEKKPNGKIGAGQGFFARAIGTGKVLFNNSMRLAATTTAYLDNSQFFKVDTGKNAVAAVTTTEKNRVWLNLTNTEGAFKQILVGYITGATNEYDNGFDGITYNGNSFVDFYSVNQDKNLVIQGRALPFVKKDSVALGYNTTIKGDFKISIDQVDGIFTTQNVLLEDKELKVQHDLKKEAYTFSTEKGTFNNRFVLRYVDKNAVDEVVIPEVPGKDADAAVMVSVTDQEIKINSVVTKLDKVVVYDVAGRKLFQKNKIDANVLLIPHFVWNHQVLIVDIVLMDGTKVSKKIIN